MSRTSIVSIVASIVEHERISYRRMLLREASRIEHQPNQHPNATRSSASYRRAASMVDAKRVDPAWLKRAVESVQSVVTGSTPGHINTFV